MTKRIRVVHTFTHVYEHPMTEEYYADMTESEIEDSETLMGKPDALEQLCDAPVSDVSMSVLVHVLDDNKEEGN